MVNTGGPSRGCITCRRRRVKCDQTKPACQRCEKLNVDCGWEDEWRALLRPQESWAKRKVARRVERAQHLRNMQDANPRGNQTVKSSDPGAPSIPMQCQIRPEVYATRRLHDGYAFSAATCPYVFDWLSRQKDTPACLKSALPAVALASVAWQTRRYDLMAEANKHYGRTLAALARSLNNTTESAHDATLLTAYLLGLFEFIPQGKQVSSAPSPFKSHGPGRMALLRLRGRAQLNSELGRRLLLLVYHDHLAAALLGEVEPIEECAAWIKEYWQPSLPITSILFMNDISSFLWRTHKLLAQEPRASQSDLLALLRAGLRHHETAKELINSSEMDDHQEKHRRPGNIVLIGLDPRLRQVRDLQNQTQPSDLVDCETDRNSELMRRVAGPNAVEAYMDTTRASMRTYIFATHIQLLETFLQITGALRLRGIQDVFPSGSSATSSVEFSALESECAATIRGHASGIIQTVPYALGEKGRYLLPQGGAQRAYNMLFPLRTILEAPQASKETRENTRKLLQHLEERYGMGIGVGLSLSNQCAEASKSHIHVMFSAQGGDYAKS